MQAVCMKAVTSSSVAKPNLFWGQILYFELKRATVFCSGHCLLKRKMTRYARNFRGHSFFVPPVYACGCTEIEKRTVFT